MYSHILPSSCQCVMQAGRLWVPDRLGSALTGSITSFRCYGPLLLDEPVGWRVWTQSESETGLDDQESDHFALYMYAGTFPDCWPKFCCSLAAAHTPCDATSAEAVCYLSGGVKYRSRCWAFVEAGGNSAFGPWLTRTSLMLYASRASLGIDYFLYFLPMTPGILITFGAAWVLERSLCRGEPTSRHILILIDAQLGSDYFSFSFRSPGHPD